MIIKKFYGKEIKEAREQAREQLGEECVILETVNPAGGKPASVTAMSDRSEAVPPSGNDSGEEQESPESSGTYGRKDLIPSSLRSMMEEGVNAFSESPSRNGGESREEDTQVAERPAGQSGEAAPEVTMSRRSTPIHRNGTDSEPSFDGHMNERVVSQEVRALHRRFDQLESLMSDALISANLEYVSHPLFQQLLNTGMRAPTVSRWFEKILGRGIDPYEQQQQFLREMSHLMREALDAEAKGDPERHLLFVGPAGSGKTSLIMKLASHPDFMEGREIALVTVNAPDDRRHYSPLPLFAEEQRLPHFEVGEGVEISKLMSRLSSFDHVLYDTPPISLNGSASFREFWQIRQLLTPVTPLEIHFTVNATLERYYFKKRFAEEHPLQPDYLAITHLDETDKWGHLLPFLKSKGCGVRYVSDGPSISEDIRHFSPSWFAEHIISHS